MYIERENNGLAHRTQRYQGGGSVEWNSKGGPGNVPEGHMAFPVELIFYRNYFDRAPVTIIAAKNFSSVNVEKNWRLRLRSRRNHIFFAFIATWPWHLSI